MFFALAISVVLALLSMALIGFSWVMAYRLTPEQRRSHAGRWLLKWSVKGLVLPSAIWGVMNLGVSWWLQPFMPQVQAAQNSGLPWFPEFLRVGATGLFVISSYWAAITVGWLLLQTSKGLQGQKQSDFKALCLTSSLGMLLPAAGMVILGGLPLIGMAGSAILAPIAGYTPGILKPKKMPPMYARAVAKLKFGKYSEAEWEIIRQLENREDDFEGWLMLADLYANQFNDLAEAEQTILEICDQPRTTSSQMAVALHKLADWHLNLAGDPEAAVRALHMISTRLPGTHLARMAQLRLNQLPATREELREQRSSPPIPLPALGDNLDGGPIPAGYKLSREKAAAAANLCVERLKVDPNNVPAREKFARLLAEDLNQVDLALEQITLLLNLPEQADGKRAEWLGLSAAWHFKYRHDPATGRKILERVIHEFPLSPQAFAARRRLRLLETDFRG